jgi:hypothetical protein
MVLPRLEVGVPYPGSPVKRTIRAVVTDAYFIYLWMGCVFHSITAEVFDP